MTLLRKSSVHVIARRSRSNLTVVQDNHGEIATLPLVARNDDSLSCSVLSGIFISIGAPPVAWLFLKADR